MASTASRKHTEETASTLQILLDAKEDTIAFQGVDNDGDEANCQKAYLTFSARDDTSISRERRHYDTLPRRPNVHI